MNATSVALWNTTQVTTDPFDNGLSSLLSGLAVTFIYGGTHLLLVVVLALAIQVQAKSTSDDISIKSFFKRIWYLRGVFTPLIVHIYDTATDIGVLYEWYFLAEYEKAGNNIASLDMELLFWVGIICMLIYRGGLGLVGAFIFFITAADDYMGSKFEYEFQQKGFYWWLKSKKNIDLTGDEKKWNRYFINFFAFLFAAIIGFIVGTLELGIFIAIYMDQTEKSKKNQKQDDCVYRPGEFQKAAQLTEGVLESMPEVILQSVFIIRSYNDPFLTSHEGTVFGLIILSIIASIFSIANKYVWIDQLMVIESAKMLFFKVQNPKKIIDKMYTKSYPDEEWFTPDKLSLVLDKHWKNDKNRYNELYATESTMNHMISWVLCDTILRYYYQFDEKNNKSLLSESFEFSNEKIVINDKAVESSVDRYIRYRANEGYTAFNNRKPEVNRLVRKAIKEYITPEMSIDIRHFAEKQNNKREYLSWRVMGKYRLSLGYIVRLVWRISAVTSRFVIFSLIWVALGGAFMVILVPIMIFAWYFMIIFVINAQFGLKLKNTVCTCAGFKEICRFAKEFSDDMHINNDEINSNQMYKVGCKSCCYIFQLVGFIIGFCLVGITFQLGILGIAGKVLYVLRMVENMLLICTISVFALVDSFDCQYCADSSHRTVYANERVLIWLIIGWASVITHIGSSFVVSSLLDEDYDLDFGALMEDFIRHQRELQEQRMKELENRKSKRNLEIAVGVESPRSQSDIEEIKVDQ